MVSKHSCQSFIELLLISCRAKKDKDKLPPLLLQDHGTWLQQIVHAAAAAHTVTPPAISSSGFHSHRSSTPSPAPTSFQRTRERNLNLLAEQFYRAYHFQNQVQEFT